jgi:hypothetical protein
MLMKKLLAAFLLFLLAAPAFAGDIFVKVKTPSDAIDVGGQPQPARDGVAEQWYGAGRTVQNAAGFGLIGDLDKSIAFMLNHAEKSYVPIPLPMDLAKVLPPEVESMASMIEMTATFTATTDTKRIGSWNCTAYDVALTVMGMPMNLRVWSSRDVPAALVGFSAKVMPAFLQGQMQLSDAAVREFTKIPGFHVATELTADIMGARMHTTTETIEIVEKTTPEGTYDPPAGYARRATMSLQDLQRR